MAKTTYTVTGYITLPFTMRIEADSIDEVLPEAHRKGGELADGCLETLKREARNLAHELSGKPEPVFTSVVGS